MQDQKKKVKVSELIINEKLTELRPINPFIVSRYRQNYRTGAEFPPIVINKDTGLIVSGNHRASALKGEYSENHKVAAIYRTYDNEREMIEDFTKENISHGNPLSGISKKKIACALLDLGASSQEIGNIFNIPIKRIEKIGEDFRLVVGGKKDCKEVRQPIKRGPDIPSEEPMTDEQYQTHVDHDRGITFDEMANQIIRWCKNGWIEKTIENLTIAESLKIHMEGLIEKIEQLA